MDEGGFDFNIAIVGLGLIGGSYAKALKALKPKKIYGIDINENVIDEALDMGIIDEGHTDGSAVLKNSDLVIIALYPEDTVKFVKDNILHFKSGAVITDTCGVKQMVIEEINRYLPENIEFVGAHPMAGKESSGLKSSSEDIFKDCNYIITSCSKNSNKSLAIIEKMAKSIGCRNIIYIDAGEHDKIMSYTSQLPHAIAVALMNSNMFFDDAGKFAGGSFKDSTRVADINSKLWAQLFLLNSNNLIDEIEKFEETLEVIKEAVKSKNEDALINMFADAGQKRRMML